MNNKGFGLPEIFVFIGISLFSLVVIAIFFRKEFNNKLYGNNHDNIVEAKVDSKYYEELEMKLKKAAINSNIDKNIITLTELKDNNLIDSLQDENGNNCEGYVEKIDDQYNSYINCYEIYTSIGFNKNLSN